MTLNDRPAPGPNAQQIDFWNGEEGEKWAASNQRLDLMLEPVGRHLLARAAPRPGESVLDIGCGGGATLLELARHVGDSGRVTGIDISGPLLAIARERAQRAAAPVDIVLADAETHPLPSEQFDLALSRFGVMFFANPAAAFANLRRGLRPGGRLTFVCWQPMARNPWMTVPREVVMRYVTPPPRPDPLAPGPFAFADPMRVRNILADAAFGAFQIEAFDTALTVGGGTLTGAIMATVRDGPMANLIAPLPAERQAQLEADLRDAYQPFVRDDGTIALPAACWVVTATRA
ncbi:MAG: methyltransferase domain-containing protein [Alphaproteobacteria bacterium]|nr:methyltransferase domain-containing protein [Alphaproteobacteria bacterium]